MKHRARINERRFLQDLHELAAIGALTVAQGGGRDRRAFSSAERQARDFVMRRATDAGLVAEEDGAANLSLYMPDSHRAEPTVLFGSHLDTVPHGGPYDGALGVVAALEVVRRVQELGIKTARRLEAIAFTDEEGRLDGLAGSRMLAGSYSTADARYFLQQAATYAEDLAAMRVRVPGGLSLDSMLAAKRVNPQLRAFVELHIEQGPQLETERCTIGVVDAIFGRITYLVHFSGRSDHAGTTPMHLRSDAMLAAARFMVAAHQRTKADFPGAVLTCGNVTVSPGVYNVVPNQVTLWVEFRAGATHTLDGLEAAVLEEVQRAATAGNVTVATERTTHLAPQAMSLPVQEVILAACTQLGYPHMKLASGALHDAHSLAAVTQTGMIFVPSRGGRSHCPDEDTADDDLVAGANVLLAVVLDLAGEG